MLQYLLKICYYLYHLFKKPLPKKELPANADTYAAVHEAGHTIAVMQCTIVSSIKEVSIEPNGTYQGYVSYLIESYSKDYHWCDMIIALAGIAAEAMIFGKVRALPAERDLVIARQCAEAICASGNHEKYLRSSVKFSLSFDKMFTIDLPANQLRMMQSAYLTIRELLEKHRLNHSRIISQLLARRTLSGKDLEKSFGGRGFIKSLGNIKGYFV